MRSAYVSLVGTLRIRSLEQFLVTHVYETYWEIETLEFVGTNRFEQAFNNIAVIGFAPIIPQLFTVSKLILHELRTKHFHDGDAIDHLAFAIVLSIECLHWRSGVNSGFHKEFTSWLQSLPAQLTQQFFRYAENRGEHNRISLKYSHTFDAVSEHDFLEWFTSFMVTEFKTPTSKYLYRSRKSDGIWN